MMKVTVLLAILCIECALAIPDLSNARAQYEEFKRKYNKRTANNEDNMRFQIFRNNLLRADQHQEEDQGTALYGVTKFADLTKEEFAARYLTLRVPKGPIIRDLNAVNGMESTHRYWDWRKLGAVNGIENQASCGSCWTFSVTGSLEGQWFIKKGNLPQLSKQQLVDCDDTSSGCKGGYPDLAFKYLQKMGAMREADYPYDGFESYCAYEKGMTVAYVNRSLVLPMDEEMQRIYMTFEGPMSTCLNGEYLQFYVSGILHPPSWKCSPYSLTHAVVTVGYDYYEDTPYWILKNSWGLDWGEMGYFRIKRGEGICGINQLVTMGVVV